MPIFFQNGDADEDKDEVITDLFEEEFFFIEADGFFDPFLFLRHYLASTVESFSTN